MSVRAVELRAVSLIPFAGSVFLGQRASFRHCIGRGGRFPLLPLGQLIGTGLLPTIGLRLSVSQLGISQFERLIIRLIRFELCRSTFGKRSTRPRAAGG